MLLLVVQGLNGLQLGLLLFLIAAGLTLVFGVMDVVNLAHGAQYTLGAYFAVFLTELTGNFWGGIALALVGGLFAGFVLERTVLRFLIRANHLDQVLATYGLVMLLEEGVRTLFGPAPLDLPVPDLLSGSVHLGGLLYPVYRLFLIGVGLLSAAALWLVIEHSRAGMLLRAGATDAQMLAALGIDTRVLFAVVLAVGAGLAGLAGALAAPLVSVEPAMGGNVLILAFVVIVLGGAGSIRGAFIGALLVGLAQTFGRSLAPALASMLIYLLMAFVLILRPSGLLGLKR